MTAQDIKKLEAEIRRLQKLAYRDELTGLLNRHGFKEEARKYISEVALERGLEEKRKNLTIKNFALIIFDADYFKKINDQFGHLAGDKVLKAFGEAILDRVRSLDLVARWGGEEIVVGLVGAGEKDAWEVAENIRRRIENIEIKDKKARIKFTVSAGVSATDGAVRFEDLFAEADKALYSAKHSGRNRVVKFTDI